MNLFQSYDPNFNNTHDDLKFIQEYNGEFKVLMLTGEVGTGKTHLSRAWMEQARAKRKHELSEENDYDEKSYHERLPARIRMRYPFVKSTEMFHGILKYLYPGIEANKKACDFDSILNYALVCVIDDLGNEKTEKDKDNFKEGFIDLLESDVKLIITTNLSEPMLLNRYGEKIYSRLKESYKKIAFKGKDYRREDEGS